MFGIFLPKFRRRGVFAHEKTLFALYVWDWQWFLLLFWYWARQKTKQIICTIIAGKWGYIERERIVTNEKT